jgi:tyrosinase
VRYRKSAEKLRPDQLKALRNGFKAIKKLRDRNGFWHWAAVHGAPRDGCEHSLNQFDSLFLPWHRAYLYRLEIALQTKAPQCTLPWWDWPASRARALEAGTSAIPPAFAEAEVDGEANPLVGSDLPPLPNEPPGWPDATERRPGPPERLPQREQIREVLELPDFDDFSLRLEVELHNLVHRWVGGSMKSQVFASYDPIFWAHHTMVDRLWSLWQVLHSQRGPRPSQWRTVLRGLDMTVEDVLDTEPLGYQYAASTAHRQVDGR